MAQNESKPIPAKNSFGADKPDKSTMSILIVEDEIIVALDLADRLQSAGFQVAGTAGTAEEALDIFRKKNVDLVLMDIHLRGERDGIETARLIRAQQSVPLIYLTAQTDGPTVERAKSTFPAAYLAKPFDEKNLLLSIELALHNFAHQKSAVPERESPPPANIEKPGADNVLRTENAIFIKQHYKFVKFQAEELLFCRADGIYTDLVTRRHKYTLRLTLQQVIDKLRLPTLVRVHRSYAVNRANIEEFTEQEVKVGGHEVPVGASFRDSFFGGFDIA